jgi:hypothetical protein
MNGYYKVRLKIFFANILFELIVNSIILLVAYFVDKLLLTILFYLPFHIFRVSFPKVFHSKIGKPLTNIISCGMFSCLAYFIAMRLMLPLNISIFSSVVVGMFINYVLYKIQDGLDQKKVKAHSLYELCKMNEEELRTYAVSKKVSEMMVDTLVLKLIYNYRWVDIRKERNYTRRGIDYHKKIIEKKLNIKF